jgi:predicted GNAT family acetyltransferase
MGVVLELKEMNNNLFDNIIKIFKKTFTDSYEPTKEEFLKRFKSKTNRIFYSLSESNQKKVSAAMILFDQTPIAHIEYLFVNPDIRGKGLGTKFCKLFFFMY